MAFKSDIEIARSANLLPINFIARKLNIPQEHTETYGKYKAKINYHLIDELRNEKDGKLILVTAISPTPAGEGKTTTSVGLADALHALNKRTIVALREPSLGPVFGIKGGAAGGGYAQVVPMEDLNLHFTGDIHAIGVANNLIAAVLDNHIQHGNKLGIDVKGITWRRAIDMNDRQLRSVVDGLGGRHKGVPREDGFEITVASEIMAILCLSESISDLKKRIQKVIVAYNFENKPVTVGDLKIAGAVAAVLKDAINPNLVQTLEHTPAFIHGGPFANIAHGCNSILATKMALKLSDYVVTEAGFGADLGAEKFVDIKCRKAGLKPAACVLVATVRALKYHGGIELSELKKENPEAVKAGVPNLIQHIENIKDYYGLPVVVAINKFPGDKPSEMDIIKEACAGIGVRVKVSEVWEKGSEGGKDLAEEVLDLVDGANNFHYVYDENRPIKEKIETIAKKIYRASGVYFSRKILNDIEGIEKNGFGKLPICMAKTQYSFSDNAKLRGAPKDFEVSVKKVKVSAGAGFIVCLTGDVMTMPGLPKVPSAELIDIDDDGVITGLF